MGVTIAWLLGVVTGVGGMMLGNLMRPKRAPATEGLVPGAYLAEPPPPPLPQDEATMARIRFGASVPGPKRRVRGRGPKRDGGPERPRK